MLETGLGGSNYSSNKGSNHNISHAISSGSNVDSITIRTISPRFKQRPSETVFTSPRSAPPEKQHALKLSASTRRLKRSALVMAAGVALVLSSAWSVQTRYRSRDYALIDAEYRSPFSMRGAGDFYHSRWLPTFPSSSSWSSASDVGGADNYDDSDNSALELLDTSGVMPEGVPMNQLVWAEEEQQEVEESSIARIPSVQGQLDAHNAMVRDELEEVGACDRPRRFVERYESTKVVLLASWPGSGNTWTRYLFEAGTRKYTGSAYLDSAGFDRDLERQFPGEGIHNSSVGLVKTHFPCEACWLYSPPQKSWVRYPVKAGMTGDIKSADAVLYLMRNPFDAMLAEFNRQFSSDTHVGLANRALFKKSRWKDFVKEKTASWIKHTRFYLAKPAGYPGRYTSERGTPVQVIFYERLRTELRVEIRKAFAFRLEADRIKSPSAGVHLGEAPEMYDLEKAVQCAVDATREPRNELYRRPLRRLNPYTPALTQWVCNRIGRHWQTQVWGPCNGKLFWEVHPPNA